MTGRKRERRLSVAAVDRDPPDAHALARVLLAVAADDRRRAELERQAEHDDEARP